MPESQSHAQIASASLFQPVCPSRRRDRGVRTASRSGARFVSMSRTNCRLLSFSPPDRREKETLCASRPGTLEGTLRRH